MNAVKKSKKLVRGSAQTVSNSGFKKAINKIGENVLVNSFSFSCSFIAFHLSYSRQHASLLNKTLNNIAYDFLNVHVMI